MPDASDSTSSQTPIQPADPHILSRPDIAACDIIGDVHGCYDELATILTELGHERLLTDTSGTPSDTPPQLLFVGDIVDRGDRIIDALKLVIRLWSTGHALVVMGNHDFKFYRWLLHHPVTTHHGLQESIDDLMSRPQDEQQYLRASFIDFFSKLPSAIRIDESRLVVVHAAWHPKVEHGDNKHRMRGYTMYGPTTGAKTSAGFPDRADWAADFGGPELVVFGHQVYNAPYVTPYAIGIDTGCVFGGALTALRYPSMELLSVPSLRARYTKDGQKVVE